MRPRASGLLPGARLFAEAAPVETSTLVALPRNDGEMVVRICFRAFSVFVVKAPGWSYIAESAPEAQR